VERPAPGGVDRVGPAGSRRVVPQAGPSGASISTHSRTEFDISNRAPRPAAGQRPHSLRLFTPRKGTRKGEERCTHL
jgi:hypothetical protein